MDININGHIITLPEDAEKPASQSYNPKTQKHYVLPKLGAGIILVFNDYGDRIGQINVDRYVESFIFTHEYQKIMLRRTDGTKYHLDVEKLNHNG